MTLGLATLAWQPPAPASATTGTQRFYAGSAFGVGVWSWSGQSKYGPFAPLSLSCTSATAVHQTNRLPSGHFSPPLTLWQSGVSRTSLDTSGVPVRSRTSATTADVNALGGLVRASEVTVTSSTTASGTGWTTSATGTTFKHLVVNDRAVPADVTPNTRFELPGYGYVVVNEQVRSEGGLTVTGLHVVVTTTTNPLHISRGIELKVSQAASSLSAPVLTRVRGYGYPGNVSIPFVDSWDPIDHWYHSEMPCLGTAGLRQTFTLEGWDGRWGGLTVGTTSRTLQSSVTDTSAVSKVSTTESSVNMLDGLVRATTIASDARVARTGSTYTVSSAGSRFSGLSVRGYPEIDGSVAPNTTITIPDVGTLYLNRVIRHANSVQLIAIRLVLTHPVAIGTEGGRMEAGTEYRIGDTKASVD